MAVKFKYKKSLYTKQAIKDSGIMSQEQMKNEYSRLARYKNARIDRLKERFPRAEILKEVDKAPKWSELLDKNGNPNMTKLSYEMSDAYRFLNRKTSTVTGYSRQLNRSIRSFNNLFPKGVNPINRDNIFDLFDFLDDYRNKNNIQKIPDSDQIIDAYVEGFERLEIDYKSLLKDIDYWAEHWSEMKDLKRLEGEGPFDSEDYKKLLND